MVQHFKCDVKTSLAFFPEIVDGKIKCDKAKAKKESL